MHVKHRCNQVPILKLQVSPDTPRNTFYNIILRDYLSFIMGMDETIYQMKMCHRGLLKTIILHLKYEW